jgi:hypothetical protein
VVYVHEALGCDFDGIAFLVDNNLFALSFPTPCLGSLYEFMFPA